MPPNVNGLAAVVDVLLLLPPKMGVCFGVALKVKLFELAAGGAAVAVLKLKLLDPPVTAAGVAVFDMSPPPPKLNTLLVLLLLPPLLLLLLLGNVNGAVFATGLDTVPPNVNMLLAAVSAVGAAGVAAGAAGFTTVLKANDAVVVGAAVWPKAGIACVAGALNVDWPKIGVGVALVA